ncbi:DNA primase [Nostocoides japonicum T1-X7]|uniref:DNA primase n=1 Tax=Nostocoides japonicum T1-X7 TaxID=1194083 RepID=A0A077M2Y0_9MICO|nr:DNA primase [Tetrasphaera japonica]CCH78555.1 DNA primase [Tetrasphaera japonica T1-X7]
MAGRINPEDIAAVKERTAIDDVVREHVTLRPAGPGSLKGLCPFHDEKTPSFTIRPANGTFKCFGCGEGGDVIEFVMKVEHLTFTESVERLAARLGMELRREDGGPRGREEGLGRRSRLLEAHRAAQELYATCLLERPDARVARDFLRARGFDGEAARRFGVGFAPRGGEELTRHLRGLGFTEDELTIGGLSARGSRGLYDRFRGRLIWPIHDITGDTIGFGARRLFDEDPVQAKYLNTAETPIYKKSMVLYGLDAAKKAVARDRTAVVVEGYTDVMAAHLAGVEGAVATCGTAFGVDHIKVLRRILRDEAGLAPARVVFTFDGDAAGQAAAMKAFKDDQRWASQSFVAVAADGMDPCELRMAHGDAAVRSLVEDAVPMFEFAVRTTIARFDLATAEGRVQAMRAAAPIVADIRDNALRPEYVRTVAGWLGVEIDQLRDEVQRAARASRQGADHRGARSPGPTPPGSPPPGPGSPGSVDHPDAAVPEPSHAELAMAIPAPDLRDPVVNAEHQLLQALLQYPDLFDADVVDRIGVEAFAAPAHRAVFGGIRTVGIDTSRSLTAWTAAVVDAAPLAVRPLIAELAVASLPTRMDKLTGRPTRRYADALVARVEEVTLAREVAEAMSTLRRLASDPEADSVRVREASVHLQDLQRRQAALREEGA